MIEIKINNGAEVAKSKKFVAKLIPKAVLENMVEKALAKKLREKLQEEGVDAIVSVLKQ